MRRFLRVLLFAALPVLTRADLKTVTKLTVAGHENIFTQYVQGRKIRWMDSQESGSEHHALATIWNFDRNFRYVLDVAAKEYVDSGSPDFLLTFSMWIRRPPRRLESGKTVDLYLETADTGERRILFGHTARHLVTRERQVAEAGACSGNSEIDQDGWYITLLKSTVPYQASLQFGGVFSCRDRVFYHGARIRKGLPVFETTTNRPPMPAGVSEQIWTRRTEIVELSEEPLDERIYSSVPRTSDESMHFRDLRR